MINRITYSVVFPSTGVALQGDFRPQPGITAVIGPNESGKTFSTVELTRYLLFGKKALRGSAADYKKLVASGEFQIRGHVYVIERSAKKEIIKDAVGLQLAVGAEEVTNKVINLLGYGLNVFDIVNASVQKQADLFGTMRPAERKKLIDEVVGLLDQEKVEKEMRAEAVSLQREAEAMLRVINVPIKPEKPSSYASAALLESQYNEGQAKLLAAATLRAKFAMVPEALEPTVPRVSDELVTSLSDKRDDFLTNRDEHRRLEQIIRGYEPSPYTLEELDIAAQRLTLADILAGQVTCPDCGSEFVPGEGHVHLTDGPDLTASEIRAYNLQLSKADQVEAATNSLALLPPLDDPLADLADASQAQRQWRDYDAAKEHRASVLRNNSKLADELSALGDIPVQEELDYQRLVLADAQYYERRLREYDDEYDAYQEKAAEISEYQRRSKAYKDGSTTLSDARATVKSYLSPAISAAASNLMHKMTNGKHSVVTVDEDMNVTIGTQSLDTLSGGAATVANIALRLALGQVLVAESFPVFFGDEMDSDADGDRRETVADALQSLVARDLVKQIILITHRSVDIADHVHDLGITV